MTTWSTKGSTLDFKTVRFITRRLIHGDTIRIASSEFEREGIDLALLLALGIVEEREIDSSILHQCHHRCTPVLDMESRSAEGLIAVSCPFDPPCWTGPQWIPIQPTKEYLCRGRKLFDILARNSNLEPLPACPHTHFIPIGVSNRRGLRSAVLWSRHIDPDVALECRGLERSLGIDHSIVILPDELSRPSFDGVIQIPLKLAPDGVLDITRGLDRLMPQYRKQSLEDPLLDLDHIRIRFGSEPGRRHLLWLNDVPFDAFQWSDLHFLRMLRLALERKYGTDGWLPKPLLRGGTDKDREVESLRKGLCAHEFSSIPAGERYALLRLAKRTEKIRLGVPPENIQLDESLSGLVLLSSLRTRLTADQERGARDAQALWDDCLQRLARGPQGAAAPADPRKGSNPACGPGARRSAGRFPGWRHECQSLAS